MIEFVWCSGANAAEHWRLGYERLLAEGNAALLAAEARGREQRAGEPERLALVKAVDAYEAASKRREHLGSYGIRIQEAAQAFAEASRVAPKAAPPADAVALAIRAIEGLEGTPLPYRLCVELAAALKNLRALARSAPPAPAAVVCSGADTDCACPKCWPAPPAAEEK